MNRLPIALCISTSIVALAVAGLALLEGRSGGPEAPGNRDQDLHEIQAFLNSLQERIDEIQARQDSLLQRALKKRALERRGSSTETVAQNTMQPAAVSGQTGGLQEQVAALTERLASLEDEENIARLAQSGSRQVAEKEIRNSLDQVRDPDADPEERLEALERLRVSGKRNREMMKFIMRENDLQERDLYLPMLDLARDPALDSNFRADVIRNFHGSEVKELRQPMLDLLASGDDPEVRAEALTTLYWHIEDATVREAIKQASQEDPAEAVQARANRILPKVEYIDREAAKSEKNAEADKER